MRLLPLALALLVAAPLAPAQSPVLLEPDLIGGPVVLMGIDAEDGGLGRHGPVATYAEILRSVLAQTRNGGNGVLVIGAGKAHLDDVSRFWRAVADVAEVPYTFVHGSDAISARSFEGFALLAVASDVVNTPKGGLTQAELDALNPRQAEVASFVNGGGGVLSFSQHRLSRPYQWLGSVAPVKSAPFQSEDVTATPRGEQMGISDALDVCCWHDAYVEFPENFDVLATYPGGHVGAIGGIVTLPCREEGIARLQETPASGAASRLVHEDVEPIVAGVSPSLGGLTHDLNCAVVVPLEHEVSAAAPVVPHLAIDPARPTDAENYTLTSAPFRFRDISATGAAIMPCNDCVRGPLPLPFAFRWYDRDVTELWISSNGLIHFDYSKVHGCCVAQPLPAPAVEGALVAWWSDLDPELGSWRIATLEEGGESRFIVQWTNVRHASTGALHTFQAVLFEEDSHVEVHVLEGPAGPAHTIGVQANAMTFTQAEHGSQLVRERGFRFDPPILARVL